MDVYRRYIHPLSSKTYSFHLTGDFLEGGTPALQERMDGLNTFLHDNVQQQYNAAVARAHESENEPSSQDLFIIEKVNAFLGIN